MDLILKTWRIGSPKERADFAESSMTRSRESLDSRASSATGSRCKRPRDSIPRANFQVFEDTRYWPGGIIQELWCVVQRPPAPTPATPFPHTWMSKPGNSCGYAIRCVSNKKICIDPLTRYRHATDGVPIVAYVQKCLLRCHQRHPFSFRLTNLMLVYFWNLFIDMVMCWVQLQGRRQTYCLNDNMTNLNIAAWPSSCTFTDNLSTNWFKKKKTKLFTFRTLFSMWILSSTVCAMQYPAAITWWSSTSCGNLRDHPEDHPESGWVNTVREINRNSHTNLSLVHCC